MKHLITLILITLIASSCTITHTHYHYYPEPKLKPVQDGPVIETYPFEHNVRDTIKWIESPIQEYNYEEIPVFRNGQFYMIRKKQ